MLLERKERVLKEGQADDDLSGRFILPLTKFKVIREETDEAKNDQHEFDKQSENL